MILNKININKIHLKGTIILFLFLLSATASKAQKITLKIISENPNFTELINKKKYTETFSDTTTLLMYLEKIKSEMLYEGYLSASFDSLVYDSGKVSAYLFTGKKYVIKSLKFKNTDNYVTRKIQSGNLNPFKLPELYEKIISEYENKGYPFVTLIPEKVAFNEADINIVLNIKKNTKIQINKVIIKGQPKISKNFITSYLSLYEGDTYNEEIIGNISSKIENLNFISEIKPPEVDFFDNKADIYLYLKRKKANTVNGVAGFIPDKNNDNKLTFTGNLDLIFLNNFEKGEKLFFKWSKTAELSQKLNVGTNIPYVFKSPFGILSQFSLDKRDTSFMKINGFFGIDFTAKNNDRISVFVRKKQSLLLSSQNIDTSVYKNTKVLLFGVSYFTQNLNYEINPSKGFLFDAGFSTGKRTVSDKKTTYSEANILAEYYTPLFSDFVLKLASDNKYSFPDNNLYENELFDLGGFSSLKGFDENFFRTSGYSLITLEARYLYEKNSNAFVFFNIAGFKNNNTDTKNKYSIPYGFGAGTDLSTKAGIFSISYALGALPGNPLQISASKIHIGYINRF